MKKNNPGSFVGYSLSILLNQFISILISLFVTILIGFFSSDGFSLLRLVLSLVVFVFLIYTNSWRAGSSDENRVRLGHLCDNKFRGLLAGLVASVPGFVFAVLAFIAESGYASFFAFIGQEGVVVINRFIHLPLGELYTFVAGKPALNILFPLAVPVISGIAYFFGRKGISIKQIIIYKADEE